MQRHFLHACVGALSLTTIALSSGCATSQVPPDNLSRTAASGLVWNYAKDTAPPGLMDTVVNAELKSSWFGDTGRMTVARFIGRGGETFYLVNPKVTPPGDVTSYSPHLSPLCGSKGCRYLGYAAEGGRYRKVFDAYLYDTLPPDVPLVSLIPTDGIPCLRVTHYPPSHTSERPLEVTRYCYDGKAFTAQDTDRTYVHPK